MLKKEGSKTVILIPAVTEEESKRFIEGETLTLTYNEIDAYQK